MEKSVSGRRASLKNVLLEVLYDSPLVELVRTCNVWIMRCPVICGKTVRVVHVSSLRCNRPTYRVNHWCGYKQMV